MVISADFEKQHFVKKISLCRFIAILLAKIARLTRALSPIFQSNKNLILRNAKLKLEGNGVPESGKRL